MRFRVLGPLELTDHGETVPIQGTKQRAMLGFLLLNANRVVSTSALMDALWPTGEVPTTARKILHNAIWGLRGALGSGRDHDGPMLITRPPGYILRLDPQTVDLYRFRRLAEEGQARLAEGSPLRAAASLREAVGLWRGAALADLVEAGFDWPEMEGLENTRIDVLEDYFDAELALGRHRSVLREMETAVEAGTLRERLCGQLMLALYRCGRHTDALGAYNRLRRQLVEQLGLEPGRSLQQLQQAILRHDDSLLVAQGAAREPATDPGSTSTAEERAGTAASGASEHSTALFVPKQRAEGSSRTESSPSVSAAPEPAPHAVPAVRAGVARQDCSVVMVQAAVDHRRAATDGTGVEQCLASVAETLRNTAGFFAGTVAAPAGPALLAVFTGADAAKRAVSTALAMLEPRIHPVCIRATVATGETQLFRLDEHPDAAHMAAGPALDTCRTLMAHTTAGTARVCERTWAQTGGAAGISYTRPKGEAAGWRARSVQWRSLAHPSIPVLDRDHELDLMSGLLGRSRHRSVAQLVTVLGEAGVGKTRLALEFERRAAAQWDGAEFLVSGPEGADRPLGLLHNLLLALCHAPPGTDPATGAGLVRQIAYGCIADQTEATEVAACASEVITAGEQGPAPHRRELLLAAGCRLLDAVALDHPLIVLVDDAHEIGEDGLDFLERFVAAAGPSPLMLIVAARPELLRRRPTWGTGQAQMTTLTLPRPTDATLDRLAEILLAKTHSGQLALPTPDISEALREEAPHSRRRALLRTLMRLDASVPDRLVGTDALGDLSSASSATAP
ncbi:BTAD domain-containing putative transcriptional regulator [Streptomyces sp. NPDC047525]|uniref:BTAD domain-containing putative transcriptional regulator n=1 Tax=Streptomyces sp. NPDC047525 TaxID=3155264 RepID=UPI0033C21CD1